MLSKAIVSKISKIVNNMTAGGGDSTELKVVLDRYIKEVDKCIVHLSEEEANRRISDDVNPIKWVTGHLTSSRNHVLNLVGVKRDFQYEDLFKGGFKESGNYPTMAELCNEFNEITGKLLPKLDSVSD